MIKQDHDIATVDNNGKTHSEITIADILNYYEKICQN